MVYELFRQFADVRQLGALGIAEVLEWAEVVLWRVDRAEFFRRFREDHAVQYFYEPFLEAFDPQLRKELGVWYTPDEVVKYMVARVDWALREELGIADGLADPSVVVLDPCCGTGAYLVEVLRKIDETLQAKGADALTRQDVKRAAMERVIGFEIMPAPFVVAHLQLGILLAELGVPLRDADERAAVYLTNALTGWKSDVAPPKEKRGVAGQLHSTLLFPEFAEERDAADRVKREEKILVVIGNPPYNIYAGMALDEERELSDAYRTAASAPKPQGRGLNDLFVRFYRMAERQITERSGRGVVCLISNNSWLDSLSFTGMRERFLGSFDSAWIDNLHGDKYKTGKLTPQGLPDPSVFSTDKNREGIQVGTAISLLVRDFSADPMIAGWAGLHYRDFWGSDKKIELLAAVSGGCAHDYDSLEPVVELGLPFLPRRTEANYLKWPRLPALMPFLSTGVITSRDQALVDIDRDALLARIAWYLCEDNELSAIGREFPALGRDDTWFDARKVRRRLVERGFSDNDIVPFYYRPFDMRWLYWDRSEGLVRRPRPELVGAVAQRSSFLLSQQKPRKTWSPTQFSPALPCFDAMDRGASCFPLVAGQDSQTLLDDDVSSLNASTGVVELARHLGVALSETSVADHVLAITHSPRYAQHNGPALMQDWPRIPLPRGESEWSASGNLGSRVRLLLDVSKDGPTQAVMTFGVLGAVAGGQLDPSTSLAVTARWGIAGTGGITMPSTGRLTERSYSDDELAQIAEGTKSLGMSAEQAIALLGETCFDVYLNDVAYWRCVPANVWRYTIGGYQIIKKWLSYRERALLGRDLKPEEARYVTEMVRRIAALVLMQPELDANYERVKADVWEWGK